MKLNKTLTLLFATAALTAAVALPAWSALRHLSEGDDSSISTLLAFADASHPVMLADNDEDEGSVTRRQSDEGEDACEEDDGNCGTAAAAPAPAPAGTVAPPQNGLFDNGAAPKAQVK